MVSSAQLAFLSLSVSSTVLAQTVSRITLIDPINNHSTYVLPKTHNSIWSRGPGDDWYQGAYPIGNGYIGEKISGSPLNDTHWINIQSLWLGGPFRNASYSAGIEPASDASNLHKVLLETQEVIAQTGNGTSQIDGLLISATDPDYGSYTTAGMIQINSTNSNIEDITSYTRILDLDQGINNITWVENGTTFTRLSLCSYPDEVCATTTTASKAGAISLKYTLSNPTITFIPLPLASCSDGALTLSGYISNDTYGVDSMFYQVTAQVTAIGSSAKISCYEDDYWGGVLEVTDADSSTLVWTGETNFDITKCTKAEGSTCKGDTDPEEPVETILTAVEGKSFSSLLTTHVSDISSLLTAFTLSLNQYANTTALATPTDILMDQFNYVTGSTYLEWLVYSYGRYVQVSSARVNKDDETKRLPPNLQGLWLQTESGPWGSDFHMDINIQMMQWGNEETDIAYSIVNMGDWMTYTLFDWGLETAKINFGVEEGYVTSCQSNVFGYVGMEGEYDGVYYPEWADYPAMQAWLLQHLHDHLDYTPSTTEYFQDVTYPLMKSHAQFLMNYFVEDEYFKDGTWVMSPCNSPEQHFVTLGCTYSQQQTFELLNNILKDYDVSGDNDPAFIAQVEDFLPKLYDGIRIGSWGQFQEWKVDADSPTDQHRHLSHLLGTYPGWQVSGLVGTNLGNQTVLDAVAVSLNARGNGTYDSDAGWEKNMRSVIASSLGNESWAEFEYRWMIESNLAANLGSMYSGHDELYQQDANGGAVGTLINMIFRSLDSTKEFRDNSTHVKILQALPSSWPEGSFSGGRLRGGTQISAAWSDSKITSINLLADRAIKTQTYVLHCSSFTSRSYKSTSGKVVGDTITVTLKVGESWEIEFDS